MLQAQAGHHLAHSPKPCRAGGYPLLDQTLRRQVAGIVMATRRSALPKLAPRIAAQKLTSSAEITDHVDSSSALDRHTKSTKPLPMHIAPTMMQAGVTADLGFLHEAEPSKSSTKLGSAADELACLPDRNPDALEDEDNVMTPELVYGR